MELFELASNDEGDIWSLFLAAYKEWMITIIRGNDLFFENSYYAEKKRG